MVENQRVQEIRQMVRDWLNEAISEGHQNQKHGAESEAEIRRQWPEFFPEGEPQKPVTNRMALVIAEAYLRDAVQFIREYEYDDDSKKRQAEFEGLTLKAFEQKCDSTIIAHNNIRALLHSADRMAGDGDLNHADQQRILSSMRLGGNVMRQAEQAVQGGLKYHAIHPRQAAVLDALDYGAINFSASGIRRAIDGRGRNLGGADEAQTGT
jgi:hypothetical protein